MEVAIERKGPIEIQHLESTAMQPRPLLMDREAADQLITYAFVGLVVISLLSATAYLALGGDKNVEEMAAARMGRSCCGNRR
jgi:hypothetical protein